MCKEYSEKEKALIKNELWKNPPWRPIPSRAVAPLLGVSLQTLANWRVRNCGPSYASHLKGKGNRAYYKPADILSWLEDDAVEPWEINCDWLSSRGLHQETPDELTTESIIRAADAYV